MRKSKTMRMADGKLDPQIPGGYYMKARSIRESKIAIQPPQVREIWDYLIREANHACLKYNGFDVMRGQLFRTYKQIREALKWFVGYRTAYYSENQTKKAMEFLRRERMIKTKRAPGGVLITICNYDFYQNPENYERTVGGTNECSNKELMKNQDGTINNNNNKELKNVDKQLYVEFLQIFNSITKKKFQGCANSKKQFLSLILEYKIDDFVLAP
jgi:hypothetical protein